ncbi:DUF1360 domain-containing protein [Streptomyces sp. NPDC003077]|uniref:DUF1360 domain-containing protein n=1 Tax=Streptomyces sp. NPDC003077 TaxID=3154443 RepID=UPI0033AAB385
MTTEADARHYDERGEVPLKGYATLATTFGVAVGLYAAVLRRRAVVLPERVPPWDVALLGAATYKASRLITKDKVTSFLRAPFTRREEDTTAGEVMDQPRGKGLRLAVGDLISCPFCMSAWAAGALVGGYAAAPRAARLIGTGFAAMTVSDWLQYGWTWIQQHVEG